MHRIYLAATMNYGLGSDDPEELAYYNKIRKEMDDMKKEPVKKGIPLNWDTPKEMQEIRKELRKLDQETKKDGGVVDWNRMLNDFM